MLFRITARYTYLRIKGFFVCQGVFFGLMFCFRSSKKDCSDINSACIRNLGKCSVSGSSIIFEVQCGEALVLNFNSTFETALIKQIRQFCSCVAFISFQYQNRHLMCNEKDNLFVHWVDLDLVSNNSYTLLLERRMLGEAPSVLSSGAIFL